MFFLFCRSNSKVLITRIFLLETKSITQKGSFLSETQSIFIENRKGKQSVRLSAEHDYYRAEARTH